MFGVQAWCEVPTSCSMKSVAAKWMGGPGHDDVSKLYQRVAGGVVKLVCMSETSDLSGRCLEKPRPKRLLFINKSFFLKRIIPSSPGESAPSCKGPTEWSPSIARWCSVTSSPNERCFFFSTERGWAVGGLWSFLSIIGSRHWKVEKSWCLRGFLVSKKRSE